MHPSLVTTTYIDASFSDEDSNISSTSFAVVSSSFDSPLSFFPSCLRVFLVLVLVLVCGGFVLGSADLLVFVVGEFGCLRVFRLGFRHGFCSGLGFLCLWGGGGRLEVVVAEAGEEEEEAFSMSSACWTALTALELRIGGGIVVVVEENRVGVCFGSGGSGGRSDSISSMWDCMRCLYPMSMTSCFQVLRHCVRRSISR